MSLYFNVWYSIGWYLNVGILMGVIFFTQYSNDYILIRAHPTRLPFVVPSDPGPEGSIHHVPIRAGVSDEGEVTDTALLTPEGGAAV